MSGHKKGSGEGWVTAEYGMLPRATHARSDREAGRGQQTGAGHFVEVQGTAEGAAFSRQEMDALFLLAEKGIAELVALQQTSLLN